MMAAMTDTDDARHDLASADCTPGGALLVTERDGVPIRLGTLADMEIVTGPAEIHRLGGKRAALVTAIVTERGVARGDYLAQLAQLRDRVGRFPDRQCAVVGVQFSA